MRQNRSSKILDRIGAGLPDVEAGPAQFSKRDKEEVTTHRMPPEVIVWHCKRYWT